VSWGVALAATSVLLIAGGAVIWANREPPVGDITIAPGQVALTSRWIPPPIVDGDSRGLLPPVAVCDGDSSARDNRGVHSVAYAVEHGTRVVKIRVVPDGDELVIDAATGRLIETRPTRPTAPPPVGKFLAPYVPAT